MLGCARFAKTVVQPPREPVQEARTIVPHVVDFLVKCSHPIADVLHGSVDRGVVDGHFGRKRSWQLHVQTGFTFSGDTQKWSLLEWLEPLTILIIFFNVVSCPPARFAAQTRSAGGLLYRDYCIMYYTPTIRCIIQVYNNTPYNTRV